MHKYSKSDLKLFKSILHNHSYDFKPLKELVTMDCISQINFKFYEQVDDSLNANSFTQTP